MAVVQEKDIKKLRGLSWEEKITQGVPNGSEFYEIDTGITYVFFNGVWSDREAVAVDVHNKVWNSDILDFVYMTQPTVSTDVLNVIVDSVTYNYIQSEEGATYKYYGFASSTGWQLKRKTLATGVWNIASGLGSYAAAWADKENKDYGYV